MKLVARSLIFLVFTGCAPDSLSESERLAEEARADSSAAGYDVGPPADRRRATAGAQSAGRPDSTARPGSSAGDRATDSIARAQAASRDTAPLKAIVPAAGAGTARSPDSTRTATPGTGRSGQLPPTGDRPLAPLSAAVEATYVAYDSVRKTVTFQLAAGDEIPEQVSFNGVRRGGRTLIIPLGWRVTIAFSNRDPQLPHSATIVALTDALPEQLPPSAFPRAQTVRLDDGLLEGDADEIIFTADHAGKYALACGVIGHAQRGQWLALEVSAIATVPRYR